MIQYMSQYSSVVTSLIEKNDMGGACSTYGKNEVQTGFWWGDLRKGDDLGDPGVDGRIILKRIFRRWDGGMD
jgi:hypothetical protein